MNGQVQSGQQAGAIVVKAELALMEVGNGPGQRETEAGPLVGPARIEAAEAAQRLLPAVERYARSAIADLDSNPFVSALDADIDLPAVGAVTDRVFEEVAERLREKLPMSEQGRRPVRLLELQRCALLVRQRVVHFGKLRRELAGVEPGELVTAGQRFGPADLEDRRQDSHQGVGIADHASEQLLLLARIVRFRRGLGGGA